MASTPPDRSDRPGFERCRNAGFDGGAEPPDGCGGRLGQGRGRGRGRRMFDPGMLRYVVLGHIGQHPRHGYDLIKLLQEQSGGLYTPSPGMIYPMLAMLEDLGHVSVSAEGNKKLYTITAQGLDFLQQNQALRAAIEEQIAARRHAGAPLLRQRLQTLHDTVSARVRDRQLSPEQFGQIASVLDKAITEIQTL